MIARRWGCTPADLRRCTPRELNAMVNVLEVEDDARRKAKK